MTSWVQAVCERQPLGENSSVFANMHRSQLPFSYSEMVGAFQWLYNETSGQGSSFSKQTYVYLAAFFSTDRYALSKYEVLQYEFLMQTTSHYMFCYV